MKIMITGANGMLGRTLPAYFPGHQLSPVDLDDFDLADPDATDAAVLRAQPDVVVHCAAFTAVDRCESEPDAAFRANAVGSASIARACRRHGARLVAISTDYVFAGDLDRPYHEWDAPSPRTVYGQSKLAGEEAVRAHAGDFLICRIAWLYGAGGPSFVHTMLKLGRQDGPPLKVVDDQIGNPTSTDAVAAALAELVPSNVVGTVHLTCEGETTWYDFTREIFRLWDCPRAVTPCATSEYPRPAPRPANSRLEKRALRLWNRPPMPAWPDALARFRDSHPEG